MTSFGWIRCFPVALNSFTGKLQPGRGGDTDLLTGHRPSSASVFTTRHHPSSVLSLSGANEIRRICWDVIGRAVSPAHGSLHVCLLASESKPIFSCGASVFPCWLCRVCGLTSRASRWMLAHSLQLLNGIDSGVGRCGNHSISIDVITERWLLREPLQETKKPQWVSAHPSLL